LLGLAPLVFKVKPMLIKLFLLAVLIGIHVGQSLTAVESHSSFPVPQGLHNTCDQYLKRISVPTFEGDNDLELALFSMKRSGHHAILSWIEEMIESPILHLNNVQFQSSRASFLSTRMEEPDFVLEKKQGKAFQFELPIFTGTNAYYYIDGKNYVKGFLPNLSKETSRAEYLRNMFAREQELSSELQIAFHRGLFVYNFEDFPVQFANTIPWEIAARGNSKKRLFILILRDPYNLFASRLIYNQQDQAPMNVNREAVERWRAYARAFVHFEKHPQENILLINYNRWFTDEGYRRGIADRLGYVYSDKSLERVSSFGGGSSFSGLSMNGSGRQLKVLERWKKFQNDPQFKVLFDEETMRLAEEIFQMPPP